MAHVYFGKFTTTYIFYDICNLNLFCILYDKTFK